MHEVTTCLQEAEKGTTCLRGADPTEGRLTDLGR
jgi:hypothetical protein